MAHSWSAEIIDEFGGDEGFFKFLKFCTVFSKELGKTVPFVPTPAQIRLARLLLANNRVVILKARQIGASTIVRAFFTWRTLVAREPHVSGIMSYTHESSQFLHGLDKGFVEGLPAALARKLDNSTARTIKLRDTGASLRAFTSGMKSGGTRSFAMSSLHLSEFAHFEGQDEVLSNAVSTVGDTGTLVIETTANGPGDKYQELVLGAPQNGWALFFSPWFEHPAYTKSTRFGLSNVAAMTQEEKIIQKRWSLTKDQMYWRRSMMHSLGPDKFCQEYPATPIEAFVSSSKTWLQPSDLEGIEVVKAAGHELWTIPPDEMEDHEIVLGVDVASGVGQDYTAMTAVSVETGQPLFHWHCNTESPGRFSERLIKWCEEWNIRSILVESNSHGAVVLSRIRDLGIDKRLLWTDSETGRDWTTNKFTKMRLLEELRTKLQNQAISRMVEPLYLELQQLRSEGSSPRSPKGKHDDLVIATGLAYVALLSVPCAPPNRAHGRMGEWIKSQRVSKILSGRRLPWQTREL